MKRNYSIILIVLLMSFVITACSNVSMEAGDDIADGKRTDELMPVTTIPEDNNSEQPVGEAGAGKEFVPVELSAGGWNFIIENYMRDQSMENAAVILGYTDTTTSEFVKEAPEGKEIFLVKMNITKDDSKEAIQWDKLILKDGSGREYHRIDDIFIDDLGMKRLPGTDLNFGTSEGWIAYEVDEKAEELAIQYEFENDRLEYTFEGMMQE